MIDHSNLEDYADPALCDLEGDEFEPDGPFYLSMAKKVDGAVLELGCGTGRITIPMAKNGIDISGLDVVPEMLAHAKSKAGELSIVWYEGDVRGFHLEKEFALIIAPGCVFEHLLTRTDQERMLACVREHLKPNGLFILPVRFPHPNLMSDSDGEQFWHSYAANDGKEVRVSGVDVYDPLMQVRHETAYRRWINETGKEITKRARLALRVLFPQEVEALLHYNGFEISHCYGGWDSSSLTSDSDMMIYICGSR